MCAPEGGAEVIMSCLDKGGGGSCGAETIVSGKVPWSRGVGLAHGDSWARWVVFDTEHEYFVKPRRLTR